MKKTIFESLAIADQERIHTQMLAWIFSEDSPISTSDKSYLLYKLFGTGLGGNEVIDKLKVSTELNYIDLVIESETFLIAIENKIKSRQGKDQLERYSKEIDALISGEKKQVKRFFLTFSGEKSKNVGWLNIDYKTVYDALSAIATKDTYFNDYCEFLKKLTEYRDDFVKAHHKYSLVFSRSGMKTIERVKYPLPSHASPLELFVCSNRLERIFCEILLRSITQDMGYESAEISESNGTALTQIDLFRVNFSESKETFLAGIQLQGNSLKLNIRAENYNESTIDMLPNSIIPCFDKAMADNLLQPNSGKTKAYRSWSKKIDDKRFLCKCDKIDFVKYFNNEIQNAIAVLSDILNLIERENKCTFKLT